VNLKPGWLEREFHRNAVDVAMWPAHMRREAGFTDEGLTKKQRTEAAVILRQRANELDRSLVDAQPDPTPNNLPAVWDLVVADMRERDATGEARYGVRLQPRNGRDALVDAYQELLDACVYMRQAIYERDGR
jgi:hypothetical protein